MSRKRDRAEEIIHKLGEAEVVFSKTEMKTLADGIRDYVIKCGPVFG